MSRSFVQKDDAITCAAKLSLCAIFLLALISGLTPAAWGQAGPPNDFFTNAAPISGLSGQFTGNSRNATRETNEPIHYAGAPFSSHSVWFKWPAPPGTNIMTFDTLGSGFDTILAAYRLNGTNENIANLIQVASDDDSGAGPPFYWSAIRFSAVGSTNTTNYYYIAVDGYSFFDFGPYVLNWNQGTNPVVFVPTNTIQFISTNFTAVETQLFATITVAYGGDGAGGGASADFFTTDGTAINGVHYLGTNGTLTFTSGPSVLTFDVPIIDNTNLNNARTVLLHLTNFSPNIYFDPTNFYITNAVLTINEDVLEAQRSRAGGFAFSSTFYSGTEFETSVGPFALPNSSLNVRSPRGVLVTVTRSAPAEGRVLVDFATVPTTSGGLPAKAGFDYDPASGTLGFSDY